MAAKKLWIVHCAAEALRRAGIAFSQGANHLDPSTLSEEQIKMLEAEPGLTIDKNPTTDASGADKTPADPAEGTVAEMKAWLDAHKPPVAYAPNASKPDLVALVKATQEADAKAGGAV